MAEGSFQEKTEQASPKKQEDARKKGQVAKSQELNSAFVMLTALLTIKFVIGDFINIITGVFKAVYNAAGTFEITTELTMPYLEIGLNVYAKLVAPIAISILVVGVTISYVQVGSVFAIESLTPKFEKINPAKGLKKMFSQRSLVEAAKSIFKVSIVGSIGYLTISSKFGEFILLANKDIAYLIKFLGSMMYDITLNITIALMFLGILDFSYQKWKHGEDLKMTIEEVKEEYKQTEGNPVIKSRIRTIQKEGARRRMLQEVPEADVIITNPTTYAIALKYDIASMTAPMVIAKGIRKVAERIKEIGAENDIPVVENKWLAQTLYKTTAVGEETPFDLYKAVAEVLAYVYKLKESK